MTIEQINFLNHHYSHTVTIELDRCSNVVCGVPENYHGSNIFPRWMEKRDEYVLGIPVRKVKAIYCCGKVCK